MIFFLTHINFCGKVEMMEFKLCNTCEHFVDCAWFCASKNRFIFDNPPEECDKVTPQLRAAARQVELADGSKGLPDSVSAV